MLYENIEALLIPEKMITYKKKQIIGKSIHFSFHSQFKVKLQNRQMLILIKRTIKVEKNKPEFLFAKKQ